MKHFKNISLEKYVPNNWLQMHGIPAKRTRQILKHFKKYYWTKKNVSIMYMFDEFYMLTEMKHAQYEKMLISGRITEEQFLNLMDGGIVSIFKKTQKYHSTQTMTESDSKETAVTATIPTENIIALCQAGTGKPYYEAISREKNTDNMSE